MQSKKFKNIEGRIKNDRKHFSTRDVLNLFELETERFRQWIDSSFIHPAIRATGTGTTHFFRRYHLYIIGTFKQLVDNGLNRQEASNLVLLIDQKKWEQIRKQKKDFYIFICSDPKIRNVHIVGSEVIKDNRYMLLYDVPTKNLDLSKLSENTDFNLAWVMNLYKIVKYVDENLAK